MWFKKKKKIIAYVVWMSGYATKPSIYCKRTTVDVFSIGTTVSESSRRATYDIFRLSESTG